jgi:hypothetical protein
MMGKGFIRGSLSKKTEILLYQGVKFKFNPFGWLLLAPGAGPGIGSGTSGSINMGVHHSA